LHDLYRPSIYSDPTKINILAPPLHIHGLFLKDFFSLLPLIKSQGAGTPPAPCVSVFICWAQLSNGLGIPKRLEYLYYRYRGHRNMFWYISSGHTLCNNFQWFVILRPTIIHYNNTLVASGVLQIYTLYILYLWFGDYFNNNHLIDNNYTIYYLVFTLTQLQTSTSYKYRYLIYMRMMWYCD